MEHACVRLQRAAYSQKLRGNPCCRNERRRGNGGCVQAVWSDDGEGGRGVRAKGGGSLPQTFLLNCGIILQVEGGQQGGGQWR